MPLVHLVSGPVGAGKTTYAVRLARARGGLPLHLDDWLHALFLVDGDPLERGYDWIVERARRLERRMVALAADAAQIGVTTVLDLGLMEAAQRERVRADCMSRGLRPTWHLLEADADSRWQRVVRRNRDHPSRVQVTRDLFDFMEARSTPLTGPDRFQALVLRPGVGMRPAQPDDADAIDALLRDAFPGPDEAALVRALPAPETVLTLVIHTEDRIAGVVVAVHMHAEAPGIVGIGPVAVAQVHQRKGLGSALMEEVLLRLQGRGFAAAVLLGDPAWYGRFGFEPAAEHGITCRWSGPAFQVRRLGAAVPRGEVRYPSVFDDLG